MRLSSESVVDNSVVSLENVWGCEVGETPNQVSSDRKQSVPAFLSGDNFGWSRFFFLFIYLFKVGSPPNLGLELNDPWNSFKL